MEKHKNARSASTPGPGETIRALRKRNGQTLGDVSARTGLAVSTLSKLEKGKVLLTYDKLMLLSKGLEVDMAQLLDAKPPSGSGTAGAGRRVVQRANEGHLMETQSYRQLYLATELLNKRFTPMVVELKARSISELIAEYGDFIRHPGEEFALVLEGEVEFHSELYAPLRLKAGDSVYFDSEMGHAYLKAAEGSCRIVAVCSPRGGDSTMLDTFESASQRHAQGRAEDAAARAPAAPRKAPRRAAPRRTK